MKFVPLPDPRKSVTPEQLADLRSMGVLPGAIGAFASVADFAKKGGIGMPAEGRTPKYWRDNSTIWNPDRKSYSYVMLDRAPGTSTFAAITVGDASPAWSILSHGAAAFYRQYAAHFPRIPELIECTLSREEAGRINFEAKGVPEDYPIGVDGRFPANCAVRFNPQTGEPEVFNFEEYVREFPFDWRPTPPPVPGSGGKLSDEELVGAAEGVLASDMDVKSKAAAIRVLVNR